MANPRSRREGDDPGARIGALDASRLLRRILEFAVSGLFWWHPLVWWSRGSLRNAEERACDAWVVKVMPDHVKAYAHTLVTVASFLGGSNSRTPVLSMVTGMGGADRLRVRIREILAGEIPRGAALPALLAFGAPAGVFAALCPALAPGSDWNAVRLGGVDPNNKSLFRLIDWDAAFADPGEGLHPIIPAKQPILERIYPARPLFDLGPAQPSTPIDPRTRADSIRYSWVLSPDAGGGDLRGEVQTTLPQRRALAAAWGKTGAPDGVRTSDWTPVTVAINDKSDLLAYVQIDRLIAGGVDFKGEHHEPAQSLEVIAVRIPYDRPFNIDRDAVGDLGGRNPTVNLKTTYPTDMNRARQVVGYSYVQSGVKHAFRTGPDRPIDRETDDLGTLGGAWSIAYAVNDRGDVAGISATVSGEPHAFLCPANRKINPSIDDLGRSGARRALRDRSITRG